MIKILLLIIAVSSDGFASAVGIGSAGIKIPFRSAAVISLTGTVFLALSVAFADIIGGFFPSTLCLAASSALLILLGVFNLFNGLLRRMPKKSPSLAMLFDGTKADADHSKTISCKEALALAVVLSADSAVTGISAGLGEIALVPLVIASFAIGLASILLGGFIGKRIIYTGSINMQWICGVILIVIAFLPWLSYLR